MKSFKLLLILRKDDNLGLSVDIYFRHLYSYTTFIAEQELLVWGTKILFDPQSSECQAATFHMYSTEIEIVLRGRSC